MSRMPAKYEVFRVLDLITNILNERENALNRLVAELSKTTEILSKADEPYKKIAKVEERLSGIQTEISDLTNFISSLRKAPIYSHGPAVIIGCKEWEEFKTLSTSSELVSFLVEKTERAIQIDALKEGRILTYSGEPPQDTMLLKIWIAEELKIPKERILEGILEIV